MLMLFMLMIFLRILSSDKEKTIYEYLLHSVNSKNAKEGILDLPFWETLG